MRTPHNESYVDPGVVMAELLSTPDAPSAISYLEATVVGEAGACGRRESAKRLWRTMRVTTPVTDSEIRGFANRIAEFNKARAEQAEGFLR